MGSSFSTESGPYRNPQFRRSHSHHPPPYYPNAPPPPNNYGYPSPNPYPNPNPNPNPTTNQYNYHYPPPPHIPSNYYHPGWQNAFDYANHLMGRPNYGYSYGNQGNGWPPMDPPPNVGPPPVYVEHQNAKVIKNDVNVHKDSIKLEIDENYPEHHLVSFVFDARFDGSISIYYFAKEEKESNKFIPVRPDASNPVKVPFQEGAGQRFCQPSGTGLDLRHYDIEVLRKPSADGASPLVICAEVTPSSQADDGAGESSPEASQRAQITHAIIEKEGDGSFQVKVTKQIVSIDGVRYEVHELYGIGSSSAQGFNDDELGKECVICMSEPKNTAVIPCRHLCMCSDCAKELRLQTNKCPICRHPITELIEIKINNTDQ